MVSNEINRLEFGIDQEKADEVVKKYDSESRFRVNMGWKGKLVSIWLIIMALFQVYSTGFSIMTTNIQRTYHLGFALVGIFLLYPASKKSSENGFSLFDAILAILSLIVNGYLILFFDDIVRRGAKVTSLEFVLGIIAILLILEAGRRVLGNGLPILATIFLVYCYFGRYFPGLFEHRGFSLERIVQHMYLVPEGIYGVALGVSATFVFLFILFGSFLNESGGAKFFNDLALAAAGQWSGGPAKVSIFASGLMGTINGSSIANVATTGAFTIPLMKKIGYKPYFAGAVSAAASVGGQIMPPVMGAAAFIMTELLGVSYSKIIIAAIVPAILYYLGIFMSVHFVAKRDGLKGIPKDMLPNAKELMKRMGHLLFPILLILTLLISGFTPEFSAIWGTVSVLVFSCFRKETRMSFKKILTALELGAKSALGVAIACAMVGFIIGTSSLTGLGLSISNNLIELAGGNLLYTMILSMIACLILGMGLPTTANYIVTSTMLAPALVKLGVLPIAAHFFVFYYGLMADLTPPVCLAAFTGAGIAGANPTKTGFTSTQLAIAAFILPYMFVYSPQLLLQNINILQFIPILISAVIGIIVIAGSTMNYFITNDKYIERIMLFAGGLLMIEPRLITTLIGIALVGAVVILQLRRKKTEDNAIRLSA